LLCFSSKSHFGIEIPVAKVKGLGFKPKTQGRVFEFEFCDCLVQKNLKMGEEIARCPSCSLYITVIYNLEDFQGRPPPPPQKKTGPPKGTTTLA